MANREKPVEKPGGSNPAFTESGVPVCDDGKLRLELHANGPVTDAKKTDLTALGAEIVAAGTGAGSSTRGPSRLPAR